MKRSMGLLATVTAAFDRGYHGCRDEIAAILRKYVVASCAAPEDSHPYRTEFGMSRSLAVALFVLLTVPACGEVPTEAVDPPLTPTASYINGPQKLPNVFRYGTNNANFAIIDRDAGLALAVAKDATLNSSLCDFQTTDGMDVQEVGSVESAFHAMARGDGLTLSLFEEVAQFPCGSILVAKGVGSAHWIRHISELPGRRASFSASVRGVVERIDDGARFRIRGQVAFQEGERRVVEIRLRPLRGNGGQ